MMSQSPANGQARSAPRLFPRTRPRPAYRRVAFAQHPGDGLYPLAGSEQITVSGHDALDLTHQGIDNGGCKKGSPADVTRGASKLGTDLMVRPADSRPLKEPRNVLAMNLTTPPRAVERSLCAPSWFVARKRGRL